MIPDRDMAQKLIPILNGIAEGKQAQFKTTDDHWRDCDLGFITSHKTWDFRIKPRPTDLWIATEEHANLYDDAGIMVRLFAYQPVDNTGGHCQIIHVREVLDEPQPSSQIIPMEPQPQYGAVQRTCRACGQSFSGPGNVCFDCEQGTTPNSSKP